MIKIAIVSNIADPFKSGVMTCHWPHETTEFTVTYTTPFYSPPTMDENSKFAGIYAVPTEGAAVLVAKVWNAKKWFYVAAIPGESEATTEADISLPTGSKIRVR